MKNILGLLIFGNPSVGSFNNRPAVAARDNVNTTLPTAPNPVVDGIVIQNNARVLFTNLTDTTLNNKVYTVSHIEDGIQWKLAIDLPSITGDVKLGDIIFVNDGTNFGQLLFCWDGEAWQDLNATVVSGVNLTNALTASSLGSVVKRMEVFDADGNSIGYVPVFDTIS